jgi:hypothetical protein
VPGSGRPKAALVLTAEEHDQLLRWAGRPSADQALALRSRIVLGCAEGLDNKAVAAREGVSPQAVGKWRARFVEFRLDGLTQSASTCLRKLAGADPGTESSDGESGRSPGGARPGFPVVATDADHPPAARRPAAR